MKDKPDWAKKLKRTFSSKYEKGKIDERLEIMNLLRAQDQAWAEYAIGIIASKEQSK